MDEHTHDNTSQRIAQADVDSLDGSDDDGKAVEVGDPLFLFFFSKD